MDIPFLDFFKKAAARFRAGSPPPTVLPIQGIRTEKPSGERMSKTVLPNTVRTSALSADPFRTASNSIPSIKLASGAESSPYQRQDLPPAVALALQPKVERAISLQLADFVDQVPSGYMKSTETFDTSRRILLKASEIEKGMANGKPSVALSTIYEQVPEIFLHSLSAGDDPHVPLPYEKVLEQFNKVQIRHDQEREQTVPQVETPILQATIEDTKRFGTTIAPLQTSAHPPVKVEPATAETLSTAEPEGVAREMVAPAGPVRKGISFGSPTPASSSPPQAVAPASDAPARIPFNLPPNGMGVPANERVPASSGPPVPTGAPKASAPARIPFKISPPSDSIRPKLTLVPGVEAPPEPPKPAVPEAKTSEAKDEASRIGLSLYAVMQNVPAFQINGSPETIPHDVRLEFPLSLIEPQLATGRVAVAPKVFREAMPETYRELLIVDDIETPVLLPLQEVLKNLPTAALKMRDDQEVIEAVDAFETPFSIKAKEDAKRFGVSPAPVEKPVEVPVMETSVEIKTEEIAPEKPAAKSPEPAEAAAPVVEAAEKPAEPGPEKAGAAPVAPPLMDIKGPAEKNQAKEIVSRASALPGVAACAVTFADGLGLAGNLPNDTAAEGLCAMAPSLLQKVERHMRDTKLGSLVAMTLHGAESSITFFMQGNICLSALHAEEKLASETQKELAQMTKELSRTYSEPEAAHVDH